MPKTASRLPSLLRPPRRERAPGEIWRSRICTAFPGVQLDWLETGPVRAGLAWSDFADTVVVEACVPPLKIGRPTQVGGFDLGYKLLLHLDSHALYHYAGHTFEQRRGDLVLLDTALPFQADHPTGAHVIVWDLPRDALEPLLPRPGDPNSCLIEGHGVGAVLSGYARILARGQDSLGPASQRNLLDQLCILVSLAAGATPIGAEQAHVARRAVQRQRILSYIDTQFRDPHVTAAVAADDLKISRRWLHALLEPTGAGFSARLARRRLEESQRLLATPEHDTLSVAQVALLAGFNDLSTFHRRFRSAFGLTPADVRRRRERDHIPGRNE